jgi:ketosteroid isomerase-like protein/limonene-1,2-epoxide hydrolase
MSKLELVNLMQKAARAPDRATFKSYFAEHVYYRVGNVLEATGPDAVAGYLRDLPARLKITRMDVRENWEAGALAIAEYTMQGIRSGGGGTVEYPCVDIYRFEGDRFSDWRVYAIEPTFIADRDAIVNRRSTAATPEIVGAAPDSLRVRDAFQGALRDGDRALALSLLTDDALVRVADQPEVRGAQAVLDRIQDVFTHRVRPSGADYFGEWELSGVLLVEMNVQATRVRDGRNVEYPCVETYRFASGKIREWRIYPIEPTLLAAAE